MNSIFSTKATFLTLIFLFLSFFGFGQSTQTFNNPANNGLAANVFTVPAGVTSIDIETWGGGGAGGGATGQNSSGGGGAGGGYVKKTAYPVVPGNTYTVYAGAGGIGNKSYGYAGNPSWFVSSSTIYAVGGNGGLAVSANNSYAAGAAAVTSGNIGFTAPLNYYGGAGGTYGGGINGGGGGGSSAGTASNGNSANFTIGGAAVTGGGKGANGSEVDGNGANGNLPGGGGAGANASGVTDRSGGNGANGQVIISWACPVFSLNTTTSTATLCTSNAATVSITSPALGLPVGAYKVTYDITGTNTATGNTATMNVTTAGSGSFVTSTLINSGATTITIKTLTLGTCSNTITANNTATITLNPTPSISSTPPTALTGSGTATLTATSTTGGSSFAWFAAATGGSALSISASYTTPTISVTTTYYVEATKSSCTSSRIPVTVTVNNPEIALSGNGFTIESSLSNTPNTGDFTNLGSTFVSTPLTRTYRIDNIGSANLTVSSITISGSNASEFVVSVPTTPIIPGSSANFTITFTPTAIGTRTADVSFTTNDSSLNGLGVSELNFKFNIAGTCVSGVTAEINLQGGINTAPANAYVNIVDGSSAANGNTGTDYTKDSGNASAPMLVGATLAKTFRIQNTGTGPLTLATTPVVITGSGNFTVISQPSSTTIAAGASLTFTISFTAATTGDFTAIATITSNDSDEGTYDFVLHGIGSVNGREIDIQGNDVTIVSGDISPDPIDQTDFGTTNTATPISIPYQIFNYGNSSSLTITSISATSGSNFTVSAVPGTVALSGIGSFVVTFTPSAVGTKTATITVVNNDSDEGTYTFTVKANVATSPAIATAPGGVGIVTAGTVSNLKFWLKADSNIGSLTDNTAVNNWTEQSTGSTKNAISPFSKEPKFKHNTTNNVNFNPVINFNGANYMYGGQGFNNRDMFIVIKPTIAMSSAISPQDIYSGDDVTVNKGSQDVTGFQLGNTSGRFTGEVLAYNQAANTAYGVGEISSTKSYFSATIFNPRHNGTRMGIYSNGGALLTTTEVNTGTYKDIINSRFWLGRSEAFDASFKGDILEIINYDIANTPNDNKKIESYLAIKYGITLGTNGTSVDYYDSSATTIYGQASGYNFNIAGIGRDDKSGLHQKQSKTENTINDITIGLRDIYDRNSDNPNTFTNDKDFLVWGNNNGTLLAQPAVIVNISSGVSPSLTTQVDFISIGRTWKIITTSISAASISTKVSVPSTLLTSTITPPGDFLMFISDSPVFNPTSEYRIMKANGSKLETNFDFNGTKYITFGYAPERTFIRAIDFNGTTDYLDSGNVLDLTPIPSSSFTVSTWLKTNDVSQTILSKRNSSFTQGYDLSINSSGKTEMSWMNGTKQSIVSTLVMPTGKWHHLSVIYNGSTSIAKLYIDGVEDVSKVLLNVPANNQSFLIAAADGTTPTSFFNGTIDEVRVWNVALTETQLRFVMNQEIKSNGTSTNGSIIPNTIPNNDISSIPWANLKAYYPMSTYTFTNAKDISSNNYTAALKNLTTVNLQTAPLPYTSKADGVWQIAATWNNNEVQELPYSLSIVDDLQTINWNIVKTSHTIISEGDKTVLGLYVDVGVRSILKATNDSKIEVSHYLKLDGKIDLEGRSQLVQTEGSYLDPNSAGSIKRDQQGQSSIFNYNYWGSPVGSINNTSINNNFTVAGVLRDGTDPSVPKAINWVPGYNGSPGPPINLAGYWIYKFDSNLNAIDYANWTQIGENGTLQAGKGFTLKGSGTTGTQNLTFIGKPNNGTITNTVSANQLLLLGNPYPSALDTYTFITDNSGSIDTTTPTATDGALYFWEHYPGNNTHNLGGYQGGYAVRNAAAGVAPSSVGVDFINTSGVSNRASPNRYIPVGQGFFVSGNATGGTVTFKNSQRAFVRENSTESQIMYRIPTKPKGLDHWTDNSAEQITKDTHKRVRLGFNNYNEIFHRQVVVAFMDNKANGEINEGYDAQNIDDVDNDMYLINSEKELIIEGEGYFDETSSYPIGVRSDSIGKISFVLDGLENFDDNQKVFIYDKSDDTYHNIKDTLYEVELPKGTFNDRFYLRFTDKTLGTDTFNLSKSDKINMIVHQNVTIESSNQLIKNIAVYDLLGRKIDGYKNVNALKYTLSHLNKTTAGLIIKITLENNTVVSKKIIF